jgi:hypothetical protein
MRGYAGPPYINRRSRCKATQRNCRFRKTPEVQAQHTFIESGGNRRKQRLVALRNRPAIRANEREAAIVLEAERTERGLIHCHGAAAFHRIDEQLRDAHYTSSRTRP